MRDEGCFSQSADCGDLLAVTTAVGAPQDMRRSLGACYLLIIAQSVCGLAMVRDDHSIGMALLTVLYGTLCSPASDTCGLC